MSELRPEVVMARHAINFTKVPASLLYECGHHVACEGCGWVSSNCKTVAPAAEHAAHQLEMVQQSSGVRLVDRFEWERLQGADVDAVVNRDTANRLQAIVDVRVPELEAQVVQSAMAMTLANLETHTAWQWVDKWRGHAKVEDDLRGWLRLCSDDPAGHAEFYQWASHLYFGTPPPVEEAE